MSVFFFNCGFPLRLSKILLHIDTICFCFFANLFCNISCLIYLFLQYYLVTFILMNHFVYLFVSVRLLHHIELFCIFLPEDIQMRFCANCFFFISFYIISLPFAVIFISLYSCRVTISSFYSKRMWVSGRAMRIAHQHFLWIIQISQIMQKNRLNQFVPFQKCFFQAIVQKGKCSWAYFQSNNLFLRCNVNVSTIGKIDLHIFSKYSKRNESGFMGKYRGNFGKESIIISFSHYLLRLIVQLFMDFCLLIDLKRSFGNWERWFQSWVVKQSESDSIRWCWVYKLEDFHSSNKIWFHWDEDSSITQWVDKQKKNDAKTKR